MELKQANETGGLAGGDRAPFADVSGNGSGVFAPVVVIGGSAGAEKTAMTPQMASGGNLAPISTSTANGATYVAFAAQACKQLTIKCLDADIEFRQDGSGGAYGVAAAADFTIFGLTDASQISVRRKDGSTAAATVYGRWEA